MTAEDGFRELAEAGLLMQAVLVVDDLPQWGLQPFYQAGIEVDSFRTLVLLGQAGTRLWEYIELEEISGDDPFDMASARLAASFVERHLDGCRWEIIYPGPALLPLGRLAELAGWGRASPVGLTINDEYGLWLAHRVAFLVEPAIDLPARPRSSHPCDTCAGKPCVAACPAGAVDAADSWNVQACTDFRVGSGSVCAHQCLSRQACPVGAQHRYGADQMRHHYSAGLAAIRRHLDS